MEFIDKDLRLDINGLSFKAYLEDSDITYETKDQQLPFTPTSFTNDSMAIRVSEKAKFTFNVYSETRYECVENYKNLQSLLSTIKPSYQYVDEQLVPDARNVTGLVTVKFKGLPVLNRESVTLHLNSFSYTMNKDLGYIHVPKSEVSDPNNSKFFEQGNMKLIPIGYKISLDGKVLLPFDQTANINPKKKYDSSNVEQIDRVAKEERFRTAANNLQVYEKFAVQFGALSKDLTKVTIFDSTSQMAYDKYAQAAADFSKARDELEE